MADSISRLIKRLREYDAKKTDLILPAESIHYAEDGFNLNGANITVTQTATQQLLSIGRIPASFFLEKLTLVEQRAVFNRIFDAMKDREFMFRLHSQQLYGIVSPSYKKMDNVFAIELIRAATSSGMKLQAVKPVINPDFMRISLVLAQATVNELAPSITITNSEVGLASLNIWAGVYRWACSNGLLIPVSDITRGRWVHLGTGNVGSNLPDFSAVMAKAFEYTALFERTRRYYLSASEKADILVALAKTLGQQTSEAIVAEANEHYNGGRTMFDTINSISAAAQSFSPARQAQVEQYAASLLVS